MNPYVAEIRMFAGNFAPEGWAFCNGQVLPISQNTALFSLLGTTYGGNGTSNFALPNLQGRVPMHVGEGVGLSLRELGETGGESTVTLLTTQLPAHTHTAEGVAAHDTANPQGSSWGASQRGFGNLYAPSSAPTVQMSAAAIENAGGNQPHNNMPPYLGLTFIIALQGVFPPRS
jgi:microcystin-dependent protein